MTISPDVKLTFPMLENAFRDLLDGKVKTALKIPGGAVVMEQQNLYIAACDADGAVELETMGEMSHLSFDDERGCWEGDQDASYVIAAINNPVFITYIDDEPTLLAATQQVIVNGCNSKFELKDGELAAHIGAAFDDMFPRGYKVPLADKVKAELAVIGFVW